VEADALVHVVDASHHLAFDHVDVVEDTLAELEATRIPKILVLNKVDRGVDERVASIDFEALGYKALVRTSGLHKTGLDELLAAVEDLLTQDMVHMSVLIPYTQGELLSAVYHKGIVYEEQHSADGVLVKCAVPRRLAGRMRQELGNAEI